MQVNSDQGDFGKIQDEFYIAQKISTRYSFRYTILSNYLLGT